MVDQIALLELPQTITIALLVIAGKYGIGDEREYRLTEEGYNYDEVQECVNELFPIIKKYS